MNAFNASFTEFCAGTGDLDQVVAALESDLQQDRRSRSESLSLIEFAWRTGKIDADSYATLREICDQRLPAPIDSGPRSGSRSDRDRQVSGSSRSNTTDETQQRQADSSAAPRDVGRADTDSTRARSQPGISGSNPSGGWMTDPSRWSEGATTTSLTPGALLKQRFVLEEVLGRGGMGTVFLAKDLRKEEAQDRFPYVAVKILNEDFRKHPDSLKALQREARKAQALAHSNIVAVYDFDRDGELVFLVMELLDGVSLERLIKDSSRRGLPHSEALRIIRGVGAALAHAHEKGVVHCDFKPANAFRCNDGTIKVFDFGISRAITRRNVRPEDATRFDAGSLGAHTPGYASCELELGGEPDPRDDVFALACVAYELFSGKHPYDRTSAVQAEHDGMKLEPIEGLDRRTWRGLQRGLAFAREDRTPSVQAFIAELAPGRRVGVAIASVAAAASVAAIGAGLWFYLSQDRPVQTVASEAVADPPRSEPPANQIADTARSAGDTAAGAAVIKTPQQPPKAQAPVSVTQRAVDTPARVPVAQAPVAASAPADDASSTASRKAEESLQVASAEVLKKQLIAAAQTNNVMNALDALTAIQARLPASDPFLVEEAPRYIGKAYQRLGDQAFAGGNFDAASSLFERAQERLGDDAALRSSRELVMRVQAVERMLESDNNIAAEAIQERLKEIRDAGDESTYSVIQNRLAATFASRIQKELETAPDAGSANLSIARTVFPGVAAIESIKEPRVAAQ